jgi:hypothetical protein
VNDSLLAVLTYIMSVGGLRLEHRIVAVLSVSVTSGVVTGYMGEFFGHDFKRSFCMVPPTRPVFEPPRK